MYRRCSIRAIRLLGLALGMLVGACAGRAPPPEEPGPPPAPRARTVPEPAPPAIAQPAFCHALRGVIEGEHAGYAGQRGRALGAESWDGRTTLPGTEQCVVEGDAWPRARYECAAASVAADQRDRAASLFALLSEQIDACLAGPGWAPRAWHANEPFAFAMGERQQTWTDLSSLPPLAVVLKLQRGLGGHDYRILLDLVTIR